MLSMVITIFQSQQTKGTDTAMPATITELYETASKAMLERVDRKERGAAASAAAVPHLTSLLEATFFEAHTPRRYATLATRNSIAPPSRCSRVRRWLSCRPRPKRRCALCASAWCRTGCRYSAC